MDYIEDGLYNCIFVSHARSLVNDQLSMINCQCSTVNDQSVDGLLTTGRIPENESDFRLEIDRPQEDLLCAVYNKYNRQYVTVY